MLHRIQIDGISRDEESFREFVNLVMRNDQSLRATHNPLFGESKGASGLSG